MTTVTLSVVSHGHGAMIETLLCDLARQSIAASIHVVLTQNIPEPDPRFDAFGNLSLKIIRNPAPRGFGANHNAALRDAATPWVMIVNPDIRIPNPDVIERLIAHPTTIGLAAPVIRNLSGEREDFVRRNLDPLTLLARRFGRGDRENAAEGGSDRFFWIAGMFLALPVAAWRTAKGFDERFFLYCEDYDLCARLQLMGRSLVIDESVFVFHDAQRASQRHIRYLYWHLTSLIRVWVSPPFWRIWTTDYMWRRRKI